MHHLRRSFFVGAACFSLAATIAASDAQKNAGKDAKDSPDAKRPQLRLKANPVISVSPAKITLVAEIVGGANDYEEYYCPTVEWDWGDGTQSDGKLTYNRRTGLWDLSGSHEYRTSGRYGVTVTLLAA